MCILLLIETYDIMDIVHEKIDHGGWTIYRRADRWMEPIEIGETICLHFGKHHNMPCKYDNFLLYVEANWEVPESKLPKSPQNTGKNLNLLFWPGRGKNYLKK